MKRIIALTKESNLWQLELAISKAIYDHCSVSIFTPTEQLQGTQELVTAMGRNSPPVIPYDTALGMPAFSQQACQIIAEADVFQLVVEHMQSVRHVEDQYAFRAEPYYPLLRAAHKAHMRNFEFFYSNAVLSRRIDWMLDQLVDTGRGKRCFVLGNGPSLNHVDIGKLQGEDVFCSNRIYLGFKDWGFHFKYWGAIDRVQIEQHLTEWQKNIPEDMIKFYPMEYISLLNLPNSCPINFSYDPKLLPAFSADPSITYLGYCSTHALMQLAATMRYEKIILLGVDHRYNVQVANDRWTSTDSSNHFHKDYCENGKRVFVSPRMDLCEAAYQFAAKWCEDHGIEVLNASPNSALTCFNQIDYSSLF